MANSLDFAGFVVAAVEAVQRRDQDEIRRSYYEELIADLVGATRQREGAMTFAQAEEICVEHGITTAHLTHILKSI
jgi:hypothetical protein